MIKNRIATTTYFGVYKICFDSTPQSSISHLIQSTTWTSCSNPVISSCVKLLDSIVGKKISYDITVKVVLENECWTVINNIHQHQKTLVCTLLCQIILGCIVSCQIPFSHSSSRENKNCSMQCKMTTILKIFSNKFSCMKIDVFPNVRIDEFHKWERELDVDYNILPDVLYVYEHKALNIIL